MAGGGQLTMALETFQNVDSKRNLILGRQLGVMSAKAERLKNEISVVLARAFNSPDGTIRSWEALSLKEQNDLLMALGPTWDEKKVRTWRSRNKNYIPEILQAGGVRGQTRHAILIINLFYDAETQHVRKFEDVDSEARRKLLQDLGKQWNESRLTKYLTRKGREFPTFYERFKSESKLALSSAVAASNTTTTTVKTDATPSPVTPENTKSRDTSLSPVPHQQQQLQHQQPQQTAQVAHSDSDPVAPALDSVPVPVSLPRVPVSVPVVVSAVAHPNRVEIVPIQASVVPSSVVEVYIPEDESFSPDGMRARSTRNSVPALDFPESDSDTEEARRVRKRKADQVRRAHKRGYVVQSFPVDYSVPVSPPKPSRAQIDSMRRAEERSLMVALRKQKGIIERGPRKIEDAVCEQCHSAANPEAILLCDSCNSGMHLFCCVPPLTSVPEAAWYCASCLAAGSGDVAMEEIESPELRTTTTTINTATRADECMEDVAVSPRVGSSRPRIDFSALKPNLSGAYFVKQAEMSVASGADIDVYPTDLQPRRSMRTRYNIV